MLSETEYAGSMRTFRSRCDKAALSESSGAVFPEKLDLRGMNRLNQNPEEGSEKWKCRAGEWGWYLRKWQWLVKSTTLVALDTLSTGQQSEGLTNWQAAVYLRSKSNVRGRATSRIGIDVVELTLAEFSAARKYSVTLRNGLAGTG